MKYLYLGDGRKFSKVIKPLLYKKIVKEIFKLNYVTKYILVDKKIVKQNCKLVDFVTDDTEKLNRFLNGNKDFIEWNE